MDNEEDDDFYKDMVIKKKTAVEKQNEPEAVEAKPDPHPETKPTEKEIAKKKVKSSVFDEDDEDSKPKKEKDNKAKAKSKSVFYDDDEDDAKKKASKKQNGEKESKISASADTSKIVEEKFEDPMSNYNKKEEIGNKFVRENFATGDLRLYHNWIKAVLINKYSYELKHTFRQYRINADLSVLDLGCGTGGDLGKWKTAKYYLGTDISLNSLENALGRWQNMKPPKFGAKFIRCSAGVSDTVFYQNIPRDLYFDIVTSQFVMHYLFKDEKTADNLFKNATKKLCKNGYFICTIPDSDVIVKRLRTYGKKNEKGEVVLGNKFYSIKFPSDQFPTDKPFGIEYGFFLDDGAVGSKVIDEEGNIKITYVPEYLIIWDKFVELAAKYDLEIIEERNFHNFCEKSLENKYYFEMMSKMKLEDVTKIPRELWEISYLYKIVAMKKKSGEDMASVDRDFSKLDSGKVVDTEEVEIPSIPSSPEDGEVQDEVQEPKLEVKKSDSVGNLTLARNQSTLSDLFNSMQ